MKKFIIYSLLYVLLGIWGAGFLMPDAGYVLLVLGQKTLETSLWFTCFFLITLSLLWWLFKRTLYAGVDLTQRLRDFFTFGSFERASKRAASGFIDFLAGDWLQARKKLLRSANQVESPVVHYLTAVQCSIALKDPEEAQKLLAEAERKFPSYASSIGLVKAKLEMQAGRYEPAKMILRTLLQKSPQDSALVKMLCDIALVQQNWPELNDLLSSARKLKSINAQQITEYDVAVHVWQMRTASQHAKLLTEKQRATALKAVWDTVPANLQRHPRALFVYVQELVAHWQDNAAEKLIREFLNKNWDDQFANLYGMLRLDAIEPAIKHAEAWVAARPQNAIAVRALGRLHLTQQAWHKARDYFKRSIELQPMAETYAELARLQHNLGEKQKAVESYQAAVNLTVKALPDLPQPAHGRRAKSTD